MTVDAALAAYVALLANGQPIGHATYKPDTRPRLTVEHLAACGLSKLCEDDEPWEREDDEADPSFYAFVACACGETQGRIMRWWPDPVAYAKGVLAAAELIKAAPPQRVVASVIACDLHPAMRPVSTVLLERTTDPVDTWKVVTDEDLQRVCCGRYGDAELADLRPATVGES